MGISLIAQILVSCQAYFITALCHPELDEAFTRVPFVMVSLSNHQGDNKPQN
jgi:hypothetical protein